MMVVFESCPMTDEEIATQNEFLANVVERIKSGPDEPRLGYIGCAPSVEVVISLDELQNDVSQMSAIIRERSYTRNVTNQIPHDEYIRDDELISAQRRPS